MKPAPHSISIANKCLISQQLADSTFKNVQELIGWMGAMQAKDYAMANGR